LNLTISEDQAVHFPTSCCFR